MDIFGALAEPTRRSIVELLAKEGRVSATQISERFTATPQAISQHLNVLREVHLVKVEKLGQKRIYQVDPIGVQEFEAWAAKMKALWHKRFDAMELLLEEGNWKSKRGDKLSK